MSRNYVEETFKKRPDHFTSDPSLLDNSKSEEQLLKESDSKSKLTASKFYADPKVKAIYDQAKVEVRKRNSRIGVNTELGGDGEKRRHPLVNMNDKESIRRVQKIELDKISNQHERIQKMRTI